LEQNCNQEKNNGIDVLISKIIMRVVAKISGSLSKKKANRIHVFKWSPRFIYCTVEASRDIKEKNGRSTAEESPEEKVK